MNMETIIILIIMIAVALVMFGIGFSQIKSKRPVGFYSGEKAPDEKELSDVRAWNVKHGMMWYHHKLIKAYVCKMKVDEFRSN